MRARAVAGADHHHARLELTNFHAPPGRDGDPGAPANALVIRHVTLAVKSIDDVLDRLRAHGAELVGELEQYENVPCCSPTVASRSAATR
jgi:hypothetical protein